MKIIEPNVELWQQDDKVSHVARCARVCYGKETGNDNVLYGNLERSKHWSMFRHETYYAAINTVDKRSLIFEVLAGYQHCPYINYVTFKDKTYIVANGNFIRDIAKSNPVLFHLIYDNQITPEEAEQIEPIWEHFMRYTFCVVTQISTSRELNRVSPNNIAEQSTRYVYEDGIICRPHWLEGYDISQILYGKYLIYKDGKEDDDISQTLYGKYLIYKDGKKDDDINHKVLTFINSCDSSFKNYKYLVDAGLPRQDARGVLPFDTATKVVYTYSADEWRAIIDLRYYGTTGQPHPNAKIAAGMIREKLMELGYEFR